MDQLHTYLFHFQPLKSTISNLGNRKCSHPSVHFFVDPPKDLSPKVPQSSYATWRCHGNSRTCHGMTGTTPEKQPLAPAGGGDVNDMEVALGGIVIQQKHVTTFNWNFLNYLNFYLNFQDLFFSQPLKGTPHPFTFQLLQVLQGLVAPMAWKGSNCSHINRRDMVSRKKSRRSFLGSFENFLVVLIDSLTSIWIFGWWVFQSLDIISMPNLLGKWMAPGTTPLLSQWPFPTFLAPTNW